MKTKQCERGLRGSNLSKTRSFISHPVMFWFCRTLMISHCRRLNDKSLESIKNLKHLEMLKLKSGTGFSENGLLDLARSFKNLNGDGLTYLNLGDTPHVSNECLLEISERWVKKQIFLCALFQWHSALWRDLEVRLLCRHSQGLKLYLFFFIQYKKLQ